MRQRNANGLYYNEHSSYPPLYDIPIPEPIPMPSSSIQGPVPPRRAPSPFFRGPVSSARNLPSTRHRSNNMQTSMPSADQIPRCYYAPTINIEQMTTPFIQMPSPSPGPMPRFNYRSMPNSEQLQSPNFRGSMLSPRHYSPNQGPMPNVEQMSRFLIPEPIPLPGQMLSPIGHMPMPEVDPMTSAYNRGLTHSSEVKSSPSILRPISSPRVDGPMDCLRNELDISVPPPLPMPPGIPPPELGMFEGPPPMMPPMSGSFYPCYDCYMWRGPPMPPNMTPPNIMPPNMVPPNMVPPNMVPPNMVPPNMMPPNMMPPNMMPPNMMPPNMMPPNMMPPNMMPPNMRPVFFLPPPPIPPPLIEPPPKEPPREAPTPIAPASKTPSPPIGGSIVLGPIARPPPIARPSPIAQPQPPIGRPPPIAPPATSLLWPRLPPIVRPTPRFPRPRPAIARPPPPIGTPSPGAQRPAIEPRTGPWKST